MQIKFLPSQGINQKQLNSYNMLAQSDYLEMDKAKLDYDWCWDTLFFGRGYMETLRFNRKRKIMEPAVINPLMFGYDPYFDEVQDWRYYWKWVTKTKWELKKLIDAGIITGVKNTDEIPSGVDSYLWDYKIKRDEAKKGQAMATDTQAGDVFQILEFYGYDDKGNKTVTWTDKDVAIDLFTEKLDLDDGDEIVTPDGTTIETGSKWPVVVKEAFREPHSSITFSVADLLEDKHRAKNVLLNLAFIAAKDQANPTYVYNPDKIKDISQFFNRQINQHIPVEDITVAVAPLNKDNSMDPGLVQFITMLQQEANEPLGTGVTMQPSPHKSSNTATEAAIDQQLNDVAQSLQSKVLQFGEGEFWSHWFHRYKKNKDLGKKLANIVGVKDVKTEEIQLKDFDTRYPPGVLVFSAKEAEFKEMMLRRDLITLYPNLVPTLGPDGMRNFNKHVFFPKMLNDPSMIDIMFPDTPDEMQAQDENKILEKNTYVKPLETDDHLAHIYTHYQIFPKTAAVWFHIAEHQNLMAQRKQAMMQQEMMQMQAQQQSQQRPQSPSQGAGGPPQGQNKITNEQKSPGGAAVPLENEMSSAQQPIA